MRFDEHRNARIFGQPHPPVEQRQAVLDPAEADVGLEIDVAYRELRGKLQR